MKRAKKLACFSSRNNHALLSHPDSRREFLRPPAGFFPARGYADNSGHPPFIHKITMKNLISDPLKIALAWCVCAMMFFGTLFLIVVFSAILFRIAEYVMMVGIIE
jgi:hypothetical protein